MPVTHVHSDSEFKSILSNNNNGSDKVFLVDFSASWCGPCKQIAPVFSQLSDKYGHKQFQFLHVDVDDCGEVSQDLGIRALPTFVFFKNTTSNELARIQGANPQALEAKVQEIASKYKPSSFQGQGNVLGGSSSSEGLNVPRGGNNSSTNLSFNEIQSIAQSKVDYSTVGSAKIGFRFQPSIQGGVLNGVKFFSLLVNYIKLI